MWSAPEFVLCFQSRLHSLHNLCYNPEYIWYKNRVKFCWEMFAPGDGPFACRSTITYLCTWPLIVLLLLCLIVNHMLFRVITTQKHVISYVLMITEMEILIPLIFAS